MTAAEEAIAYVRSFYDESIFPPRPKGPHSEVYDGEAAAVARLTCDNIARELAEREAIEREAAMPEPGQYEAIGYQYSKNGTVYPGCPQLNIEPGWYTVFRIRAGGVSVKGPEQ